MEAGEFSRFCFMTEVLFNMDRKTYKGYSLIIAFPSTGLVGVIAARHLIEKLPMKSAGFISSSVFAPVILIQDGLLNNPVRAYASDKHKLLLITSEQVLHEPTALHSFASRMGAWIKKQGFSRIVSISGILAAAGKPGAEVYGVSANQSGKTWMEKNKVIVLKEGISTGISPLLLLSCAGKEPAVQLLGEISFNKDYAAAAAVLRKVSDMLNLKVNVAQLEKEAEQMKENLRKDMEKLQFAKEHMAKEPASGDKSLLYG